MSKSKNLPPLPSWLAELIPEARPAPSLSFADDGESYKVVFPDGSEKVFISLEEVNEAVQYEDVFVSREVKEKLGPLGLMYPITGSKYFGMVSTFTDDRKVKNLQASYLAALSNVKAFRDNPDSFPAAWKVVDTHPAFWVNRDLKKYPYGWETHGHCSKLHQYLYKDDDGVFMIRLETGSHVEKDENGDPAYKEHYGDWRLEVEGVTFEEAMLKLARNVLICFNDDGSDNPDAETAFAKPEWVKELESRIQELDSRIQEGDE